uniref:t-SNARE coiled-coil homology domain-containing protein n=1 Tax=Periophthalmus magnuspinnatus TaxID=409849 RepID=A0A3B4BCZ9_9GOBI
MENMTVEQMTMRANQVTDESLKSTRRMLFVLFSLCFVILHL